jgi:hypothetical protein
MRSRVTRHKRFPIFEVSGWQLPLLALQISLRSGNIPIVDGKDTGSLKALANEAARRMTNSLQRVNSLSKG